MITKVDEASRLLLLEHDVRNHAKSLSELTLALAETQKNIGTLLVNEAGRLEREKATEARLDAIYRLGWWILTTIVSACILVVVRFFASGGFQIGVP